MSRKIKFIIYLGMFFVMAMLLGKAAQVLDTGRYPLVTSLTCIETGDASDLYWNINQIEWSGGIAKGRQGFIISLRNNIPNFDSYYFRLEGNEQWETSKDDRIEVKADEALPAIELRATNAMGGSVPARLLTIRAGENTSAVVPGEEKIENGRHRFRFEKPGSAKTAWLREHTLPVIAACPDQWSAFLALRAWVKRQIPDRYPSIRSQWDAQRILQNVWSDPSVGYFCDAHAATYVSACISVGLNARMIHLGDENHNGHYAAEVWSDVHNRWIFMDPLYDCHYTWQGAPLSAIELHALWKQDRMAEIATHGSRSAAIKRGPPSPAYASLFQDIQLINSNDFMTTPLAGVLDLITLKIRSIRFIDEANPPYNRMRLAAQIMAFYYLPRFISSVLIPFVIPALLIVMTMRLGRKGENAGGP